jgi:hypothetical protein
MFPAQTATTPGKRWKLKPPRYTEDEISESMEFWGEWPTMDDKLDAEALKKGLESSGLNVQVIDEHPDFSKLKFWGDFPTEGSES